MSDSNKTRVLGLALAVLLFQAAATRGRGAPAQKKSIRVQDAIGMVKLGLPDAYLSAPINAGFAKFSPDGREFTVVLKRGDLQKNTNDYSLLLYRSAEAFRSPRPKILAVLSTSSNRPAIKETSWLADSKSLTFIGERAHSLPQVYELNVVTKSLAALTSHRSPVVDYATSTDGRTILFEADPRPDELQRVPLDQPQVVATHDIISLLLAPCGQFTPTTTQGEELFLVRNGRLEMRLQVPGVLYSSLLPPSVSPNGRFGIVGVFLRRVPPSWSNYKVPWLTNAIRAPRGKREAALAIAEYMVINTSTGRMHPLLDAPVSWQHVAVRWAKDSRSVAVSGTFLPVARAHSMETQTKSWVVEIDPETGAYAPVTDLPLSVEGWSPTGQGIFLGNGTEETAAFEKSDGSWKQVPVTKVTRRPALRVTLQEDLNRPPELYVVDPSTNRESALLDLNPQFSALRFGRVEAVRWKATDGHEVSGGLFFPPQYKPGKQYPLVIQTHGFFPQKFYMDGPWSSAFAARPLAARGFFVLQVGYSSDGNDAQFENTPREGPRQMAAYEGAILYLDSRGLIDPERVGIIGFSRTVYSVAYTLTHSHCRFAAATLADGITGGYFDYLALPYLSNIPLLNGGPPFGSSLVKWLKSSPNFNLDKVRAPVRIEAYGPASLLGMWGWFSGLSMLRKPVELVYLPGAAHLLTRPVDRLASQQGNVDWFSFWLKGEEIGHSRRRIQLYLRWNALRQLATAKP